MKQILQNARTGALEMVEVPAPAVGPGLALVRNVYSVMSPGTDKMAMDFARKSMLGKARSRPDLVKIDANLLVERDSQKRIVIGTGGRIIKKIGIAARRPIEELVGTRVHLQLWVKVDPQWLKKKKRIEDLGYR